MTRKKLRITQIAPLWIPVPPRTYGGIELMLYHLIEELEKRDYPQTLFASGDSKTSAKLVPIIKKGIWLERNLRSPHASVMQLIKITADRFKDFDLIHNHFNFFTFPLSLLPDCPPFLTTIHRPMDPETAEAIKAYPEIKICAISKDHEKSMKEYNIDVFGVAPNGIDVKQYEFNKTPEDYLLYLGRLNREKGIITALEVAKATRKKLIVAGNIVGPEEWLYFMHDVQPLLNEEFINFRGEVDFNEKIRLLKNAKALLFPIDRREPFGLVMIEAMACGTPVIGFRKGSVPEVIEHGKTGFIVNTKEEMAEAIKHIDEINREDCRKHVENHFTVEKMVDAYEKIYKNMLE